MALFPLGILSAAGAGGADLGSYDLLETQILGSAQASVTFSSLGTYSSTYKHLQIRAVAKTTNGFANERLSVRLNGITAASYADHELFGNGSSLTSSANTNATVMQGQYVGGGSTASTIFGAAVIDILDAYSTTKNTTIRTLWGTSALVGLGSGFLNNTDAVSSIALSVGTFVAGSRFSLYGIKG
jgi:hypothetical protein